MSVATINFLRRFRIRAELYLAVKIVFLVPFGIHKNSYFNPVFRFFRIILLTIPK